MVSLLISFLMVLVIFGVIYYIITLIPLPAPFATIAQIVMLVIFLLVLIGYLMPMAGVNFGSGYIH